MPTTSDPERALRNRIEKDRLFGDALGAVPAGVDFEAVRRWEQEAYDANVRAWLVSDDVV